MQSRRARSRSSAAGGTAKVWFRGATYVLASGSRFFTMCYTPSKLARGLIPMVALPDGKNDVSEASVPAAPTALGEFGLLADRLAGIGHAGQSFELKVLGGANAKYSTSATETILKGGPVQAVVRLTTGTPATPCSTWSPPATRSRLAAMTSKWSSTRGAGWELKG